MLAWPVSPALSSFTFSSGRFSVFVNFVSVKYVGSTGSRFDSDLHCSPILLTILTHEPKYTEFLTTHWLIRPSMDSLGEGKTDSVMWRPPMDTWVQPVTEMPLPLSLILSFRSCFSLINSFQSLFSGNSICLPINQTEQLKTSK